MLCLIRCLERGRGRWLGILRMGLSVASIEFWRRGVGEGNLRRRRGGRVCVYFEGWGRGGLGVFGVRMCGVGGGSWKREWWDTATSRWDCITMMSFSHRVYHQSGIRE